MRSQSAFITAIVILSLHVFKNDNDSPTTFEAIICSFAASANENSLVKMQARN